MRLRETVCGLGRYLLPSLYRSRLERFLVYRLSQPPPAPERHHIHPQADAWPLEPCPPSYFVIGLLRLLAQSKPDLIAVAAIVKRHISEP